MAGAFEIFVIVGVIALVMLIAVLAIRAEKKRSEALAAAATLLGLQFDKKNTPADLADARAALKLFQKGHARHVQNIVGGDYKGIRVRVLEFHYTTGSGKNQTRHHNVVALAVLPVQWPGLSIDPENIGHKLFDAVGGDDIDFESEEFSRKYWVKAANRKFAYDVVNPRMMEYLMGGGWQRWEIVGPYLGLWDERNRLDGHEVQPALDRLIGFVQLVPSYLRGSAPTIATVRTGGG